MYPQTPASHALDAPQAARTSIRFGERFAAELEVRVTPLGLVAVGALVSAILLSVPPIIHAAAAVRSQR